jgi:hypothetical protein
MIMRMILLTLLYGFIGNCLADTISTLLPYQNGQIKPVAVNFNDMPWQKNPDGSQFIYLVGHPDKPGLFILLAKDIPGYKNLPHYHNNAVFVTLLNGTFNVGYGNTFDRKNAIKTKAYNFLVNPPDVVHFEWTETGATTQIIGIGPWKTIYVDEKGKPQNK